MVVEVRERKRDMGISMANLTLECSETLSPNEMDQQMRMNRQEIDNHEVFMRGVLPDIRGRVSVNTDRWFDLAWDRNGEVGYRHVYEAVLCGELWSIVEDGLYAHDMVGIWWGTKIDDHLEDLEARVDILEPRVMLMMEQQVGTTEDERVEQKRWACDTFKLIRKDVIHYAYGSLEYEPWELWDARVEEFKEAMMISVQTTLVKLLEGGGEDMQDIWENGNHYNDALGACVDAYILILDDLYKWGYFSQLLRSGLKPISKALNGPMIDTTRITGHPRWTVLDGIFASMHTLLEGISVQQDAVPHSP